MRQSTSAGIKVGPDSSDVTATSSHCRMMRKERVLCLPRSTKRTLHFPYQLSPNVKQLIHQHFIAGTSNAIIIFITFEETPRPIFQVGLVVLWFYTTGINHYSPLVVPLVAPG